jgi:hypothetical protein
MPGVLQTQIRERPRADRHQACRGVEDLARPMNAW